MVNKLDQETQRPGSRWPRRATALALVGVVLLGLYLLPQLPPVRGWLLSFATDAAARAGYSLRYERDRGNLWNGLRLDTASVSGPGVALGIERLSVSYFLPGLLTGRLPLSLEAEGVRGELTLSELPRSGGTGGGLPVRPVLRDVRLDDVEVGVNDIPFTLPDLTLSDVRIRSASDEALRAEARLSSPEGEADIDARVTLSPFSIVADIPEADVAIARHWWGGIEGGKLEGTVRYEEGQVRAEARVENGALQFLGEPLSDISGRATYVHPQLDATLTGTTLGGEVNATGGVFLGAPSERRWFAEASGGVDLRDTALWLAEGRLPVNLDALPLSGRADVRIDASGWRDVNLTGTGQGAGTLAGYPVEDLLVDFGFSRERGASADISAVLAGGALEAALTPTPAGFDFSLNADDVAPLETLNADVRLNLVQDGSLTGDAVVALRGQLLDRDLDLSTNGSLSEGALRLPLTGEALGGNLTGTVALVQGVLDAQVDLRDAALPRLSEPVNVSLQATGPPTALPLSLTLNTPEQTQLELGPVTVEESFSGTLSAVLRGTNLASLEGNLGPLALQGNLALAAQDGTFRYSLDETSLGGVLEGTASVPQGELSLQAGGLAGTAALTSSALALPGTTLPPLDATLTYAYEDTLTLTLADPAAGIDARLDTALLAREIEVATGSLVLRLDNTPLGLAGQPVVLTGRAEADPSALLDSLIFGLRGQSHLGEVRIEGDADEAQFELERATSSPEARSAEPGSLDTRLETVLSSLQGNVRLRERTAQLTGQLGALDLNANASFGDTLQAEAVARSGLDSLRLALTGSASYPLLDLSGTLPAAPLGDLIGVNLSGNLSADLQRGAAGYSGSVDFSGEAATVPVNLRLEGVGDRLELRGDAEPLDIPVSLTGRVQPDLRVRAESAYGTLRFADGRLSGGGTLPGVSVGGLELASQPWRLTGSLAEEQLEVNLPAADSRAQLSWGQEDWQIEGNLSPSLAFRDGTLALEATLSASAADPRGSVAGTLRLTAPATSGTLALTGSLDALRLGGSLPAEVLSNLAGSPVNLLGDLVLNAGANLLDGPSYDATFAWQTPQDSLDATLIGSGADLTFQAVNDTLEVRYDGANLRLTAADFDPAAFAELPLQGRLNGTLTRAPDSWDGTLSLVNRSGLNTQGPLESRITLSGEGEALNLTASVEQAALTARAQGQVWPELALAVEAEAAQIASLDASVTGPLSAVRFGATLQSSALDIEGAGLELPEQTLFIRGGLENGLSVRVSNTPNAVQTGPSDSGLSGSFDLPFRLQGEPHLLSATLGGEPADPRVSGTISGAYLSGPLDFDGERVETQVDLSLNPWLETFPVRDAAAELTIQSDTRLNWQAEVSAAADVRTLPASLTARLAGNGSSYEGEGVLSLTDSPVSITVAGSGSDAQLSARLEDFDLAALNPALPTELSGLATGTLRYDTSDATRLRYDVNARGKLQERDFSLNAAADDAPLRARLVVDGANVFAEQAGANSYRFSVDAPAGSLLADPVSLAGRLELAPDITVAVEGQLGAEPLALDARYTPADMRAVWNARYGGASVNGEATRTAERWTILGDVRLPEETGLPVAGQASLSAQFEDGNLRLERLEATTELGGRAADVSLTGSVWPETRLDGRLDVAGFDPADVGLTGEEAGYALSLMQNGLRLRAEVSLGFQVQGARLSGRGPLPLGQNGALQVEPGSDLLWTSAAGFSGEASLQGEIGDLGLELALSGEQRLAVEGTTQYAGERVAELGLSLGPDLLANPELSGTLTGQLDLSRVTAYEGAPLLIGSSLNLDGTLSNLRVRGPLRLSGALEAGGHVAWSQGNGELRLQGSGLDLGATLDAAGWRGQLTTENVDLSSLVPQLASPRLSTEVNARQSWGTPPSITANPVRLETANSLVSGNVTLSDSAASGVRGRLEAELDLRDLAVGPELRGTLAGNLTVASPDAAGSPRLGGSLALTGLELDGDGPWQGAALDGTLGLSGSLASPFVTAQLTGSGTATGALFASFRPTEAFELRTDLSVAGLGTDLNLSLNRTDLSTLEAEGSLRYGDYALNLVPSGERAFLLVEGEGRLAGWQAEANLAAQTALVRGNLNSVNSALQGEVSLNLNAANTPLVSGALQSLSLGPVSIGDVNVSSLRNDAGRRLNLEGERLAAGLNLADFSWSVTRFEPNLPGEVQLELSGKGRAAEADLQGRVALDVLGEVADLPLELSYQEGVLSAKGAGTLLGGELALELSGAPDVGWQGGVALRGAALSGFEGELDTSISGPFTAPSLQGTYALTRSGNPQQLTLQGDLLATRDGLDLTGDLTAALLDTPVSLQAAPWPERTLTLSTPSQTLQLRLDEGTLSAAGRVSLALGPANLSVREPVGASEDAWLSVALRDVAPGLGLETLLFARTPGDLAGLLGEGLRFTGTGTTEGEATLVQDEGLRLGFNGLRWRAPLGTASLSGNLRGEGQGFYGSLRGTWQGDTPFTEDTAEGNADAEASEAAEVPEDIPIPLDTVVELDTELEDTENMSITSSFPWLSSLDVVEFQADVTPEALSAKLLGNGANATLLADLTRTKADLAAVWGMPRGAAALNLGFTPETGLNGSLSAENFPLFSSEASGAARLDAKVTLENGSAAGTADLHLDGGAVALEGRLGLSGLVPAVLAPNASEARRLSAQLDAFDVSAVPIVARYAPFLSMPLSGELSLSPKGVDGHLQGNLIADEVLGLDLTVAGQLADVPRVNVKGRLERSTFDLDWTPQTLAGLIQFENFPLETGFAANAGPTDVEARLTGALRFDVPRTDPTQSYVRFTSEQLSISRDGILTEGALSFELNDQDLTIQEARFEGDGVWQASGEASRERLNLRVDAQEADFGPLLALIPPLAGLDAGASGSLQLVSSGSLLNPNIRVTGQGIELSLAGSSYELDNLSLTVQNTDFVTSGRLKGVAPLTGSLGFSGGGQLLLAPERSFNLALRFQGNPSLPVLGTIDNVEGTITARPGEPWRLDSSGVLGEPFSLRGNLTPLDLRLTGDSLDLKAPQFLLAQSATDTDLRFVWDNGLYVSGGLFARRALLNLEGRERRENEGSTSRRRSPAFARVFFDDVALRAPQQILFDEAFGTGELGNVDLVLGGTAARPFLSGSARALRGTVRFSGRDFSLGQSVATFQPSQGIFPSLDINARTSFNKTQVLNDLARDISFVEPGGSEFQLRLQLAGSIEPSPEPTRAFVVNISPELTSNAVILSAAGETRGLSEAELFSLLSLGRLQLSPQFASGSGVATSLAEGALDTAVDFLILSELQRELGSALGLDLIEIRTTSLSSLISGEEQDFGVSLRIGGYLTDEVFASYRIGSIGLADGVSLSNELNLRYTLDPLEFSLVGTLDFRDDGSAVPAIDFGIGYALSPALRLEAGSELSTVNQGFRFGVSLRW